VIHKAFHHNGSPDLRRWVVQCDLCGNRRLLFGSADWLVPASSDMHEYCPDCVNKWAVYLIWQAISCPGCGNAELAFWPDNPDDPEPAFLILCTGCESYLEPVTGWHTPPPGCTHT
jgi:ribosomal protein S27E